VIIVVVLQNSMDLLKGEAGFCNRTSVMSTLDGNTGASIEAVREEEGQDPTTIPAIKTEPCESFVSVVGDTQISYRLYAELPAPISLCPCET
jgi:hypothetical protein